MTQATIDSPDAVLAAALFNSGLKEYRAGQADEALNAFAEAARLEPSRLEYAIVACKASFSLGRWDEARLYLKSAETCGLEAETSERMSRAIDRAVAVGESNRVPVRFEPGPPGPPESSWTLAFCDWLEGLVHEFCQELRESIALNRARH